MTTVTDADVPSTLNFDKISFNHREEAEVEFPVGAKVKQITINVTAKVKKMLDSSTVSLASSRTITFHTY